MNLEDLFPYFFLETTPAWICPTCAEGTLEIITKEVKHWETAASKIDRTMDDWEPEQWSGTFLAQLKCSRNWCGERVVVSGEVVQESLDGENVTLRFMPKCFHPSLSIIKVPDSAPQTVHRTIYLAGSLLYADPSSSGNKVRIAVEQLLDHFKVKRFTKKGKRIPISLQRRIDAFGILHSEEAKLLTACKWLGNVASHSAEQLTFRQAVLGFQILELVLNMLFDTKSDRIKRMAQAVNKRKGKPLRKRAKLSP